MPPPYLPNASVSMVHTGLGNAFALFQQVQVLQSPQGTLAPAVGADEIKDRLTVALRASEAVPGLMSPEDAAKIRGFIQSGNHLQASQRLSAYHSVLQLVHDECTTGMPAAASLPLEHIAGLFGLPPHEFETSRGMLLEACRQRSAAMPLAPAAAPNVELMFEGTGSLDYVLEKEASYGHELAISIGRDPQNGAVLADHHVSLRHAKISFWNGRYWLEDQGSSNGTYHNGRRLSPHERQELRSGDRIQIGLQVMTARLPYQIRLNDLADMMKDAPSYRAVFAVLKSKGFEDIIPKIRDILTGPLSVGERLATLRLEVPYDGGLLLKLEALLLRGEVVRLRSLYFPKMTPEQALETSVRLTASLAQAHSFADLSERLRRTNTDGFRNFIERLARFERENSRFADIPETFGLRDQVKRLFLDVLSIDADQRQDLQWRGVTPDMLGERPWKNIAVSPLLQTHLDPFRGAIGKRLNIGQWNQLENTLTGAFAHEQDEPNLQDDAEEIRPGATQHILYDKYQGKQASTDTGSTLTESQTESKKAGFFARILDRLIQDRVGVLPDGYWFFGGSYGVRPRFEGRIYLSLRRRHAEAIYRTLAKDVEGAVVAQGGKIQFKIAGNPEGYSRADSGVIYFHAKDQETILEEIRKMHREHPEFFKPGAPLFTMPLMEGLSFGEHPHNEGESFGSLRTNAMTTAVRVARALMGTNEPPDWDEIRQICAYFLKRAGVDIENPSFNAGGPEKFGPLLSFCDEAPTLVTAKPETPAPVPPPATLGLDPKALHALIASEILARYPALQGYAGLVEKVAQDIFQAWERSGQFPGQAADAPSYVPEEIFDKRIGVLMATMDREPEGTVLAGLREEMRRSDQGPRGLRSVRAWLSQKIPAFQSPELQGLLRALANDGFLSWQAKDPTAAGFEEAIRKQLSGLLAHLNASATPQASLRQLQSEISAYFLST